MPSPIHKVEKLSQGVTVCGADGDKVVVNWVSVTCKKCLAKKKS